MTINPIAGDPFIVYVGGYYMPWRVFAALGYSLWDTVDPEEFVTRWCRHWGAVREKYNVVLPLGMVFHNCGEVSRYCYVGKEASARSILTLCDTKVYQEVVQ